MAPQKKKKYNVSAVRNIDKENVKIISQMIDPDSVLKENRHHWSLWGDHQGKQALCYALLF